MSTKTKTCKKPAKTTTTKPTEKKSGKVVVNGDALKKAIAAREQPKTEPKVETSSRFHIWDVYGVKYLMDDNMVPTRRVSWIEVTADHDTSNEPDLRNALIDDAEQQLTDQGFFMTDVDAMEDALRCVEPNLDTLRHDIKYGKACPKCSVDRIDNVISWLEFLRNWRNRRFDLAEELGGTCNLPPVIPNDYQENWHVEDDRLVPNNPKPKVIRTTKIEGANSPEELAKAVATKGNLPKELANDLAKKIPDIIKNVQDGKLSGAIGLTPKKAIEQKK